MLQAVFTYWIRARASARHRRVTLLHQPLARHAAISEYPGGCAAERWGRRNPSWSDLIEDVPIRPHIRGIAVFVTQADISWTVPAQRSCP